MADNDGNVLPGMEDLASPTLEEAEELCGFTVKELLAMISNAETFDGAEANYGGEGTYRSCFLGTVMNLAPSGKYYMPWCSNFDEKDADEDGRYFDALDQVAEAAGGYIAFGEGDLCDVFFSQRVEEEEEGGE